MSSITNLLLESLDELVKDDFERFKSSLTKNWAKDFSSIPRSKLEHAKQHQVVELMVDQYGPTDAARFTIRVLKDMQQNRLAKELEKKLAALIKDQTQAVQVDGVSSSSAQAAGISQTISADNGIVHAPILSGGTYNAPVNFNFNNPHS